MDIKLVVTDIDGVWTDGGMYYDGQQNELKRFHTYDSAGVIFLRISQIPLAIVTGENTKIVARRSKKLKIEYLFQGITNKLECVNQLCQKLNIQLNQVAFIGDDINDIHLLKKVGLSAVPASAPAYIQNDAHWILTKNGGDGVFREFVERILEEQGLLDSVIQQYLKQ